MRTAAELFASAKSNPPLPTRSAKWALFLDVDGTLLDLAPTPDAVRIPSGLITQLAHFQQLLHGAVALLSGRSIHVLDQLFAPLQLPCAGLHGLERRGQSGRIQRAAVDPEALRAMRLAARRVKMQLPDILLEDKGYTIAFHYRQAKMQQAVLRAKVAAIARDTHFVLQVGHDVYELKPPGSNKGLALTEFLREPNFSGRLPIYLGDDRTDEHALAVAQHRGGLGIHIGNRIPSAAQFGLADPTAVSRWLQRWEEQLS
jgi:trehalose 6-phosphate phosphatase